MGQSIASLAVSSGSRERSDIRPGNQVTVNVGVVNFEIRLFRIAKCVVSLRTSLLLRELEGAIGRVRLPIEACDEFANGRLQGSRIVHFKNNFPPWRGQHRTVER